MIPHSSRVVHESNTESDQLSPAQLYEKIIVHIIVHDLRDKDVAYRTDVSTMCCQVIEVVHTSDTYD